MIHVDCNAIITKAPIAELVAVNPERYEGLGKSFTKNHSLVAFVKVCYSFCVKEPEASFIKNQNQKDLLLDRTKKVAFNYYIVVCTYTKIFCILYTVSPGDVR